MLSIDNLHAAVDGNEILKGLTLDINPGEVHAIMGPNGSGKSTLSYVLAGREDYEVTDGDIFYDRASIMELAPDERAALGIFLAFQYPVEIPGVATTTFLRTALNALRRARGEDEINAAAFLKKQRDVANKLGVSDEMLKRPINVGFSGGEKKRMEALQMALLEPRMVIMDETDSGLDIDALRIVAENVNRLRAPDRSFLIITHYQRLLDHIKPDYVHIMADGRIVQSGGPELAHKLEAEGYAAFGIAEKAAA
ncbi:MAG TPA: Fe-S cluster assembly ATPase SufC [Rhodospirillaceae bacterium]|nr:Fe-S cluster assembly ATPase SufC [Rhodospirillaceae bacterium]